MILADARQRQAECRPAGTVSAHSPQAPVSDLCPGGLAAIDIL
jgi:hypothetical protein